MLPVVVRIVSVFISAFLSPQPSSGEMCMLHVHIYIQSSVVGNRGAHDMAIYCTVAPRTSLCIQGNYQNNALFLEILLFNTVPDSQAGHVESNTH